MADMDMHYGVGNINSTDIFALMCGGLDECVRVCKSKGRINYTVWSEVFTCPECTGEIDFVKEALDKKTKKTPHRFTHFSVVNQLPLKLRYSKTVYRSGASRTVLKPESSAYYVMHLSTVTAFLFVIQKPKNGYL
jgi:hypothetical protein